MMIFMIKLTGDVTGSGDKVMMMMMIMMMMVLVLTLMLFIGVSYLSQL